MLLLLLLKSAIAASATIIITGGPFTVSHFAMELLIALTTELIAEAIYKRLCDDKKLDDSEK